MHHRLKLIALLVVAAMTLPGCVESEPARRPHASDARPAAPSTPTAESSSTTVPPEEMLYGKPVIYLYPPRTMPVRVGVSVDGRFTETIPSMDSDGGWSVTAHPSGRITDSVGGTYPYLFWEAVGGANIDLSEGFIVSGKDTRHFLVEKLTFLGLSKTEASEFTAYWAPRMEQNSYNLIRFEGPAYERLASLSVSPNPDVVIRVFMAFAPLEAPRDVPEQQLTKAPARHGFTVVEWGGTELPAR